MKLYDLKKSKDSRVIDLLETEIDYFISTDHAMKNNYKNLIEQIDNYYCFNVLVDGDHIVAFSGLYNNGRFPKNTARTLNRLYYSRRYRTSSLFPRGIQNVNAHSSLYMLPYQISVARKNNLDNIFVSVENYSRRNKFFKIMELSNNITGYKFENLPGMYNTCKIGREVDNHISCWQNISLLDLTGKSNFNLASITTEQWIDRFEKNDYYKK